MSPSNTFLISLTCILVFGCQRINAPVRAELNLSEQDKEYWYSGKAEISSYKLEQARYGELRKGYAILVFVTEPFSLKHNTKSDKASPQDVSVLKMVKSKSFVTGIYPYSILTTTFFPFQKGEHALKVSSSSQEWCGHSYMELTNRGSYDVQIASYFQGESQPKIKLKPQILEDELWSVMRIRPDSLPTGTLEVIPSFFYLRLMHKEFKPYTCITTKTHQQNSTTYKLNYPDLNRSLKITYSNHHPHVIDSWEETYESGWGDSKKMLTTTGERLETIQTDYWNKNRSSDSIWRDSLKLNSNH